MTEPERRFSRRCACCAPPRPAGAISRRAFLGGAVAATAAAAGVLAVGSAGAQTSPGRIDVHHHLAPPRWIAEVVLGRNTGQRPLADWTPQRSIEDMDRGGVATSI